MKRAVLTFHRYANDQSIRLVRILGRQIDATGAKLRLFRYAPSENGPAESRFIQPGFDRALRHGAHTFRCAPGLYHNVNSRDRKIEKDTAKEYTLVFDLPYEDFAHRRSLRRDQALEAADGLDQNLSPLDIYRRLFPNEKPGTED